MKQQIAPVSQRNYYQTSKRLADFDNQSNRNRNQGGSGRREDRNARRRARSPESASSGQRYDYDTRRNRNHDVVGRREDHNSRQKLFEEGFFCFYKPWSHDSLNDNLKALEVPWPDNMFIEQGHIDVLVERCKDLDQTYVDWHEYEAPRYKKLKHVNVLLQIKEFVAGAQGQFYK